MELHVGFIKDFFNRVYIAAKQSPFGINKPARKEIDSKINRLMLESNLSVSNPRDQRELKAQVFKAYTKQNGQSGSIVRRVEEATAIAGQKLEIKLIIRLFNSDSKWEIERELLNYPPLQNLVHTHLRDFHREADDQKKLSILSDWYQGVLRTLDKVEGDTVLPAVIVSCLLTKDPQFFREIQRLESYLQDQQFAFSTSNEPKVEALGQFLAGIEAIKTLNQRSSSFS